MRPFMSRARSLFGVFVVMLAAGEARAADERAIILNFTPTQRAQIAIWIESADGTFLSTVGLTQAVSVRGIGNRPGARIVGKRHIRRHRRCASQARDQQIAQRAVKPVSHSKLLDAHRLND